MSNLLERGIAQLGFVTQKKLSAAEAEQFQRGLALARTENKKVAANYFKRGYMAAGTDRLTSDWQVSSLSADGEIRHSLRTLRNRCRDLEMNNPYMRAFLSGVESNVIGANGITLKVSAVDYLQKNGSWLTQVDTVANKIIEDAFWAWGKPATASLNGKHSWIDLQTLCVRSVARDGEIFFQKIKGANNKYGFTLKPFEADFVDEEYNLDLSTGGRVRMGIEFDANEKPVAYHVFAAHPGDYMWTLVRPNVYRVRVPADEIVHYFIPTRFHQSRGVPWACAIILNLNMIGAYAESELVASRLGANKAGFFTTKTGEEEIGDVKTVEGSGADQETVEEIEVAPGTYQKLPPGVDFKPYDPQHPAGNFDMFMRAMLRGISSGVDMAYPQLANDYGDVNYSSLRGAALWEREHWKKIQRVTYEHFHDPVYSAWLDMALISGAINLPYAKYDKFNQPVWRPRTWPWVDPLKDIQAAVLELDNGLTTRTKLAAEKGEDFLELIDQYAEEQAYLKSKNLDFSKAVKQVNIPAETTPAQGGGANP